MQLSRIHILLCAPGLLLTLAAVVLLRDGGAPRPRTWELHTAPQPVAGTEELETGRLDAGIAALVAMHIAAPGERPGTVLTNLCLAYTLKRDYNTALGFCNRAIAQQVISRDAYNNRGVLQALRGDYMSAVSDFQMAACEQECPDNLAGANPAPSAIVARNLDRARAQLDAMMRERDAKR